MIRAIIVLLFSLLVVSCAGKKSAEDFWRWFESHSQEFSERSGKEAPPDVTRKIDEQLRRINPLFSALLQHGDEGGNELIVTVHGNEKYFPEVESLIQAAPKIAGWHFVALVPPSEISDATELFSPANASEGAPKLKSLRYKARDILYSRTLNADRFDLVIYFPDEVESDWTTFTLFADSVVEESLGERLYASVVGKITFKGRTPELPKDLRRVSELFPDISSEIKKR